MNTIIVMARRQNKPFAQLIPDRLRRFILRITTFSFRHSFPHMRLPHSPVTVQNKDEKTYAERSEKNAEEPPRRQSSESAYENNEYVNISALGNEYRTDEIIHHADDADSPQQKDNASFHIP